MLALLFMHILISVTCLLSGFLVHQYVLNISSRQESGIFKPAIIYLVTGLITITLICQWIILFHPISFQIKIALLVVLLCTVFFARKRCVSLLRHLLYRSLSEPVITAGILLTWLLILVMNAGPTMMDDTESYHIQMVKWIEEFGSVPGLANLHERYGFNSSWFAAIGFFNYPNSDANFYTALNGTISFWFATYLLGRTGKFFSNAGYKSVSVSIGCLFIFIICLVSWPMLRGNATTCNYDFITTVCVFVLCCEMMLAVLKSGKQKLPAEWIIWPVYLFTVRIINYPFLLLSLYGLFTLWRERKHIPLLTGFLFALLLTLPFLVRNIILSGYPFFPSLSFDWFNTDWKASEEKTIRLLHFIKYFNRVNAGIQDVEVTAAIPFPQWIVAWFTNMFWYDKLLVIPGVTGIIAGLLLLRRLGRTLNSCVLIFFIVLIIQLISWFLVAPDPRFVYGTLLCGLLSGFTIFNEAMRKIQWARIVKPLVILTIATLPVICILKIRTNQYQNWVLPFKLPQPPVNTVVLQNTRYHIPEKINNNWNNRCYGTALPCLYEIQPGLQRRGPDIADGFRIKK